MKTSFNLGKLFGIRFRIHITWFIIFFIATIALVSPNYTQWSYWVISIVTIIMFFASVVAHELAHSLVGRANGIPIHSITLFIFGGVAQITREATRPSAEFKMAVAGPVCSLVIGGIFGLVFLIFGVYLPEPVSTMILWLALMNGVLAVFNLIPGFPLDGGRVFRSLLWRFSGNYNRSTRIAARVGQGVGYLFIITGIIIAIIRPFDLSWFDGIWITFIGWFLVMVATSSYRQIQQQEAFNRFIASGVTNSDRSLSS